MNAAMRLMLVPVASAWLIGCATNVHANPRHAPSGGAIYDYAPVVDARPVLRTVRVEQPRTECWQETTYQTVHHGYSGAHGYGRGDGRVRTAGPTIAGGVVGGVIGRQFGSGSGRDGMTLLGTLVGAAVANERAHNRSPVGYAPRHSGYTETRPVSVERCEVRSSYYEEQRLEGYDVTYLYAGREFVTRTAQPPGRNIRVRVDVHPVTR
ncbi:MAG: glycine zipper 2TM domain-containing protein [Gammaproteobacteria bacterium]|nr:glycine zipper 2TM domain-containing protein [Gammaproteobacteria bacterium]